MMSQNDFLGIYNLDDLDEDGEVVDFEPVLFGCIETTRVFLSRIRKQVYEFRRIDFPFYGLSQQPVKLRRHYKSYCIICDKIDYSFNKNRMTKCFDCMSLIIARSGVLVLTNKHREFKKRMRYSKVLLICLLKRLQTMYDVDYNGSDWSNMVYHAFGKIPQNVCEYIVSYI